MGELFMAKEKILIFFLILSAILLADVPAFAAEEELSLLSVDGNGSVQATPNKTTIEIGVSTNAKDAATAQNENARLSVAVQNAVNKAGIDKKFIKTKNYSFRPTYSRNERKENEIVGYVVDNTVIVTVHDLELVGKVIDTALRNGANRVNSLNFSASNDESAKKVALNAALADAKSKAEIIAKGLGKKIIGIHRVSESTGAFSARSYNMVALKANFDMSEATTPVEAPELTLNASVHIEFILEK